MEIIFYIVISVTLFMAGIGLLANSDFASNIIGSFKKGSNIENAEQGTQDLLAQRRLERERAQERTEDLADRYRDLQDDIQDNNDKIADQKERNRRQQELMRERMQSMRDRMSR